MLEAIDAILDRIKKTALSLKKELFRRTMLIMAMS